MGSFRSRLRFVGAILFALILASCGPPPVYKEEVATFIGRSVKDGSPLSQVKLAVALSENFHKARKYLSDMGAPGQKELTDGFNAILTRRFKEVIQVNDLNSAREKGADLAAVVDARVTYSLGIFDDATAHFGLNFMTLDGQAIDKVSGNAKETRYVVFGAIVPAIEKALAEFSANLDAAPNLKGEAERIAQAAPEKNVAGVKATPQAEKGPHFPEVPITVSFIKAQPRPDDIAVIIGNADYGKLAKDIPNVTPAYADAAGMKRYITQALGVSEDNVIFLKDAKQADLVVTFGSETNYKGQLHDWIVPGQSRVFVYYSGHGAPGEGGNSYLVPADAQAARIELNGYPLKTLYENLGKLPAKSVTVVLEACFSGTSDAGSVISSASPVYLNAKKTDIPPNITVVAAGAANQIASWEEDKSHGLFTKYFLKGMSGEADAKPYGNGDGNVGWSELKRYLDKTVTRLARRYYGRDQTAQIVVGQ